ncbi:DUF4192 family protein [uncultured Microbacterium sp.]|uniref:DUF4192 family protein n=1 Tax=uncultured Microbacterium sp. TaxID=191216 RepID=UPI0025EBCB21|nr:DUF4192 family protein [uncultured Microbacterium sp.]
MTTIVHAAGAAELLAAIPALTGFTPRNSLVLLPFRGARTAGAIRFDLPPSDDAGDGPPGLLSEFAATAVGLVRRVPGTDALAIAVYADPDGVIRAGAPPRPPRSGLVGAVEREAERRGLRIVEALHVGGTSWADYRDPAFRAHPVHDLPDTPAVPGFVGPAPDQLSGAELPRAGLVETESVGRALQAIERVLGPAHARRATPGPAPVDPRAQEVALLLDDLPSFLEDLLDSPEASSPFLAAALAWILNRPALRDVALVQWARGIDIGDAALTAQLAFTGAGIEVPAEIGRTMIGQGPRPDPDRLGVALTLVRRTASLAPCDARGGPLAAAAWLSWAIGRSTHAAHYLGLLAAIDPDLSFARLLRSVVDGGILPAWAFRGPTP